MDIVPHTFLVYTYLPALTSPKLRIGITCITDLDEDDYEDMLPSNVKKCVKVIANNMKEAVIQSGLTTKSS